MSKSLIQDRRECYVTGSQGILHKHHIFGGGRRALSEKYGLWVYLTPEMHNLSGQGVHFNTELDAKIKADGQAAFEARYGHDEFMRIFKKNYL